jgi:hypothetical protein
MTDQKPTFDLKPSSLIFDGIINDARAVGRPELGQTPSYRIARLAFAAGVQAGADAELDACAEQLNTFQYSHLVQPLKDARRPKPPSTRQKARNALALAMREAGKGGRIFDGSPFYELQDLIEELPDA